MAMFPKILSIGWQQILTTLHNILDWIPACLEVSSIPFFLSASIGRFSADTFN